jgi:TonB-dependent SusC/RagA subfamily outer membrane receptor
VQVDALQRVSIESTTVDSALNKCLFIVDGVETSYEEIRKLLQNSIEWINILKDESAMAKYGEKGRYGVVIIKTKPEGYKGPVSVVVFDKKDTLTMRADTIHYKFPDPVNK